MFDATMNLTSFAVCTQYSHIYRILINYISSRISLTTTSRSSHHKQFQMHFWPSTKKVQIIQVDIYIPIINYPDTHAFFAHLFNFCKSVLYNCYDVKNERKEPFCSTNLIEPDRVVKKLAKNPRLFIEQCVICVVGCFECSKVDQICVGRGLAVVANFGERKPRIFPSKDDQRLQH